MYSTSRPLFNSIRLPSVHAVRQLAFNPCAWRLDTPSSKISSPLINFLQSTQSGLSFHSVGWLVFSLWKFDLCTHSVLSSSYYVPFYCWSQLYLYERQKYFIGNQARNSVKINNSYSLMRQQSGLAKTWPARPALPPNGHKTKLSFLAKPDVYSIYC